VANQTWVTVASLLGSQTVVLDDIRRRTHLCKAPAEEGCINDVCQLLQATRGHVCYVDRHVDKQASRGRAAPARADGQQKYRRHTTQHQVSFIWRTSEHNICQAGHLAWHYNSRARVVGRDTCRGSHYSATYSQHQSPSASRLLRASALHAALAANAHGPAYAQQQQACSQVGTWSIKFVVGEVYFQ
jgi:hypothetical protein